MKTNSYPLQHDANRSSSTSAEAALEFGRFRVLLRHRQLLADDVPVELGTRAFDLLLVPLEADGSLLSKEELLSRVAGHRGIGREPQGSDLRVAQSARRGPRYHPH
jgi:DNA-binding winged helix-turn-helix (wHTH) protein